jgi:hypothetical protein
MRSYSLMSMRLLVTFSRTRVLEKQRQTASCATFLVFTLLLPLLLTAPVERDIRLITLINPFYAAAARVFTASPSSASSSSLLLTEGRRALRTAILCGIYNGSRCLPFGLTGSPYRCKCPVYTSCERQGSTFKHRIDQSVSPWHKPRRRGRTSARC